VSTLTVADLPPLRRSPVPVVEPRPALRVVDDPPPTNRWTTEQGTLPLDLRQAAPSTQREQTSSTSGGATHAVSSWTRQFVQAAVEIAAGRRHPNQLVRWTTDDILATLARRGMLATRAERAATSAALPRSTPTVRSVRVCELGGGVVEACAVVADRGRARAVALRLEDSAGRWRVTEFETR
jgi:hypothetical protein